MPYLVTEQLLALHDKYDGDLGLLHERWADKRDRARFSDEQIRTLGEYLQQVALGDVECRSPEIRRRVAEDWRELSWSVREAGGENAANAWMLEALAKVPLSERAGFLDRISYLHSPEAILGLDAGLDGEGERIDHATAFVWATIGRESSIEKIMNLIPEAERGAVIGQLRGVTKPGPLAGYLRRQGTSEEEVTRIVAEAGKPWE